MEKTPFENFLQQAPTYIRTFLGISISWVFIDGAIITPNLYRKLAEKNNQTRYEIPHTYNQEKEQTLDSIVLSREAYDALVQRHTHDTIHTQQTYKQTGYDKFMTKAKHTILDFEEYLITTLKK